MKENRRNVWKRLSAGLLVIAMAVTLAFGGWSGEAKAAVKPKLSKTSVAMYPGQSTKLKVKNTSAKIKWSSSNKKIAKVSSKGTVKAVKLGKCTITAKVKGKKLKCKVAVVTKENYRARKLYDLVREKEQILARQYDNHIAILNACKEGDPEKICREVKKHYWKTIFRMMQEQKIEDPNLEQAWMMAI